jgi:taurine dioxygenase
MSALAVRRLGYALGAEVTGVDLSQPLDDATVAEIRKAWLDHIVLSFPRQALSPDEFTAFCRQFGPLTENWRSTNQHPEFPDIMLLTSKPVEVGGKKIDKFIAGAQWHSDLQFSEYPSSATFLLAQELPDIGGNTLFANMYLAYEALSPAMQRMIDPLSAVHDTTLSVNYSTRSPADQEKHRLASPPVVHPVVRVHPETGRKALFIGRRVRKFLGMTEEETQPLLAFLNEHAIRYEFIYRYIWSVSDLVMWDNRCAMHYAIRDFDHTQMRRMIRCSLLPPRSGYVYTGEDSDSENASREQTTAAG